MMVGWWGESVDGGEEGREARRMDGTRDRHTYTKRERTHTWPLMAKRMRSGATRVAWNAYLLSLYVISMGKELMALAKMVKRKHFRSASSYSHSKEAL